MSKKPAPKKAKSILSIRNLAVDIVGDQPRPVIKGLNLDIPRGQTVALLGESGSGKTLAAYSVLKILPSVAQISRGKIMFGNVDLLHLSPRELRTVRGNKIGMIYQEPGTALDPLMPVGKQIGETLRQHKKLSGGAVKEQVLSLMELVGIPAPHRRYRHIPVQFSGGARQRVVIAMALACRPDLLLADEPTSALDTTVQAHILDLLARLIQDLRMSVFLISHDIGVIAALADRVAVLKGGIVVEEGTVKEVLSHPAHPYTAALLAGDMRGGTMQVATSISQVQSSSEACPFVKDCKFSKKICREQTPAETLLDHTRMVRCFAHSAQTDSESKK